MKANNQPAQQSNNTQRVKVPQIFHDAVMESVTKVMGWVKKQPTSFTHGAVDKFIEERYLDRYKACVDAKGGYRALAKEIGKAFCVANGIIEERKPRDHSKDRKYDDKYIESLKGDKAKIAAYKAQVRANREAFAKIKRAKEHEENEKALQEQLVERAKSNFDKLALGEKIVLGGF